MTYRISVAGIDLICLTNARFRPDVPGVPPSAIVGKSTDGFNYNLKMQSMLLVVVLGGTSPSVVYNVKDFGVVGDGRTVNTEAIKSVFTECRNNKGEWIPHLS